MSVASTIDSRTVFRRSPDVVCRRVGAESILVPIRHNVGNLDYVYTLSAVSSRVWELLDGTRTVEAIVEAICAEYDVARETAAEDVGILLGDLFETALISQVSSPE